MRSRLCILLLSINLLFFTNAFALVETADTKSTATSSKELTFEQVKTAAEGGDADAQYALGYLYFYGKNGAPKDNVQAKNWIAKAADQKQPQAIKALALISKAQTATQTPTKENDKTVSVAENNGENVAQEQAESLTSKKSEKQPIAMTGKKLVSSEDGAKTSLVHTQPQKTPDNRATSESTDGLYTLQLLGASNKDKIVKLINDHHLGAKAKIYQSTLNGRDWFVLTYGQYKSSAEAKTDANRLAEELALKPWVKPYSSAMKDKLVSAS